MIRRSALSWQKRDEGGRRKGKRKKKSTLVFIAAVALVLLSLSWLRCSPAPAARRAPPRQITAHHNRPALSSEKKRCFCWLPNGDCLSVASLLHDPASLPASQQRRPSQMLHGSAGVCHSTPSALNTSQLSRAWTTTTVAILSNSLPDRQIVLVLPGEF